MTLAEMFAVNPTARGRSPREFAVLAKCYVDLVAAGCKAPHKALAANCGGTPSTWANRLTIARKRGLLTEGRKSRAISQLTSYALRLLEGAGK